MSVFEQLIDGYIKRQTNEIHTAIPGHIERIGRIPPVGDPVDLELHHADVQPIDRTMPLLINVPTVIGPLYSKGDKVLVVFGERPEDSGQTRRHALDDGYVVGRLP